MMPQFAQRVEMVENQSDVAAMLDAEKQEEMQKHERRGQPLRKTFVGIRTRIRWAPTGLFNGIVAPAVDFTMKGIMLDYQGETDSSAGQAPLYERRIPAMITDWRAKWGEGDFSFLFCADFELHIDAGWTSGHHLVRRNSVSLKLVNTGMAVSLDVGQAGQCSSAGQDRLWGRVWRWRLVFLLLIVNSCD